MRTSAVTVAAELTFLVYKVSPKRKFSVRKWTALLCFLFIAVTSSAAPVFFPHPKEGFDVRNAYPVKLLKAALSKAGKQPHVIESDEKMSQSRAILLLQQQKKINVLWTMTSKHREEVLLPIRIPIDKGLFGWRVALIRADMQDRFKDVNDLTGLREFKAVQGHDWPDFAILKSNGLRVEAASNYSSFFMMLTMKRVDYFPRSIVEIIPEYNTWKSYGIAIEKNIILYYRTAHYFFVNKNDTALAAAIESGLEKMLADGEFERMFRQEYSGYIAELNLPKRALIVLDNPDLPPLTPVNRKELWYTIHGISAASAPPSL